MVVNLSLMMVKLSVNLVAVDDILRIHVHCSLGPYDLRNQRRAP